MNLTIRHSQTESSFAELAISSAKIVRKKSAADEFRATFADPEKSAQFSTGDIVEIFKDGVRKFYGSIVKLPSKIGALDEAVELVAKGPWFDLESIVYQQSWRAATFTESGAAVLSDCMRSKVVLGQNSACAKITAAAQLTDIFAYAISKGANFSVAQISGDTEIPLDEAQDLTCAEAAARVLKWLPDSGAYFDYSSSGLPTLSVLPRSALTAKTVDLNSGLVKSASVGARPDLRVNSVSVKYESEHSDGANSWLTLSEDNYPEGVNYGGKNSVVMSVELAGLKGTCQVYEIECQSIQPNSAQWWRDRIPALSEAADLEVLSSQRAENSLNLPRFLVSGTIPYSLNFQTSRERINATVQYTDANGSVIKKDIGVQFITTNANSGTYTTRTMSQLAEPAPTGLAQAIYNAASAMQYEGTMEIFGADSADYAAAKISVTGGRDEWVNMQSPVASVTENLGENLATIKFGPPTHLYPDNIAEIFRIGRIKVTPYANDSRSGGISASKRVFFSGANSESESGQGDAAYEKFVIGNVEENGSIELGVENIGSGATAKMREIYVTKNAKLATANVLMTDPVETQ